MCTVLLCVGGEQVLYVSDSFYTESRLRMIKFVFMCVITKADGKVMPFGERRSLYFLNLLRACVCNYYCLL